jgi:hypothetical protein
MPTTLTPNYLTGKAVALQVGGALAYTTGGNIARSVVPVKVTNARSGGFQQLKAGVKGAKLSMEAVYNGDDPPTIQEGTEITVIFDSVGYETSENIENSTGGVATTPLGRLITAQYLVTIVTDTWQVEADYKWSLEGESTGAYTVVDTATGASPIT